MQVSVVNAQGSEVNTVDLPTSIFDAKVNVGLMHQALVRQLANARRGTHKSKGRSEVSRTNAKIYRQKGTGNARHGSRRAPIFVGGGVAHGPKVRDYSKKMPRKMRRAAIRSALTNKASNGDVIVVEGFDLDAPKTKVMAGLIRQVAGEDTSALVVIAGRDEIVEKSARNLPHVKVIHAHYLNIRDVLGHDKLVLSADALDVMVGFLGLEDDVEIEENDDALA